MVGATFASLFHISSKSERVIHDTYAGRGGDEQVHRGCVRVRERARVCGVLCVCAHLRPIIGGGLGLVGRVPKYARQHGLPESICIYDTLSETSMDASKGGHVLHLETRMVHHQDGLHLHLHLHLHHPLLLLLNQPCEQGWNLEYTS